MPHVQYLSASVKELAQTLAANVLEVKQADPFAEVGIVVASLVQARYLKKIFLDAGVPGINVQMWTLDDLTEMAVDAVNRAGIFPEPLPLRSDISGIERELAVDVAIACTKLTYFEGVQRFHGFSASLLGLFKEIEDSAFSELLLDGADDSPRGRDLALLFASYLETLGPRISREKHSGLLCSALELAQRSGTDLKLPSIVRAYGFSELTGLQQRFFKALALHSDLELYVRSTSHGEDETAPRAEDILPGLSPRQKVITVPCSDERSSCSLRALEAPGPENEVREAIREALKISSRSQIDLKEMAFVVRDRAYDPLLFKQLLTYKIPFYMQNAFRITDSVAFTFLRTATALLENDHLRGDVVTLAGLVTSADEHASLDISLREHEFTGGLTKLTAFAKVLKRSPEDPAVRGLQKVLGISEKLRRARKAAKLSEAAQIFASLLEEHKDLLRGSSMLPVGSNSLILDIYKNLHDSSFEEVLAQITKFTRLDLASGLVAEKDLMALLWDHLARELAGTYLSYGTFMKDGLNVLTPNQFRGLTFKVVLVLGTSSKTYPTIWSQDALMPDRSRQALNKRADGGYRGLTLARDQVIQEQYLLAEMAAQAEDTIVFSFSTQDDLNKKASSISFYALELLGREAEEALTREDAPGHSKIYNRVTLSDVYLSPVAEKLDRRDALKELLATDRVGLVRYLLSRRPAFKRRACAVRSRYLTRSLTAYDGMMDGEGLELLRGQYLLRDTAKISPSRLEKYAKCPFNYFMIYVLGAQPLSEPEHLIELDPQTRGTLFHKILRIGSEEALSVGMLDPGTDLNELRPYFLSAAKQVLSELEDNGQIGYPLLWSIRKNELLGEIMELIDRGYLVAATSSEDLTKAHRQGPVPKYFEHSFDVSFSQVLDGYVSSNELERSKRIFGDARLYGSIDRIDQAEDGRFEVIDYKTGKFITGKDGLQDESLNRGATLQVPLYSFAYAAQRMEQDEPVDLPGSRGRYLYATKRGGFKELSYSLSDPSVLADEIAGTMSRIGESIEQGIFIPYELMKGKKGCKYCDQVELCDLRILPISAHKMADPRVQELLQLVAPKGEDTTGSGGGEDEADE